MFLFRQKISKYPLSLLFEYRVLRISNWNKKNFSFSLKIQIFLQRNYSFSLRFFFFLKEIAIFSPVEIKIIFSRKFIDNRFFPIFILQHTHTLLKYYILRKSQQREHLLFRRSFLVCTFFFFFYISFPAQAV